MAAKSSTAPAFIWNWIVETLANSEQADIPTLTRLVKLAPAIAGDAGKNAREAVYLRILEKLFDHGDEAIVESDSAQNARVGFDVSESCEDVLKLILHKTPEPMTRVEKEKWDIRPFLIHKRSSLPKCSLTKLKEGICESSHPRLASLKESSKVVIENGSEGISPVIQQNKFQAKESLIERSLEGPSGNKLNEDNLPQDTCMEGRDKRVLVDILESFELANSKEPTSGNQPDKERADDGGTDIAAKKEAFLNSRYTLDQDSFAITELSEIDLCMKCNENGQMLVCSSDTCPLRIHESCLGSAVTFDENGEFFCPFCAYSRAISKYHEAKKKVSLARKDLQAFTSFTVKRTINKSSMEQNELDKNEDIQMGAKSINCTSNEEDSTLPDPIIPDVNSDPPLQQTNGLPQNSKPEPSTPKQTCNEKESQKSTESPRSRILRKRKAQYACVPPPIPTLRRKVLQWTKSEEEILKEGVDKYSDAIYKGIPWKEILYFGRNVFHKSRTTIDLKDKWRNMCKGSPNVE